MKKILLSALVLFFAQLAFSQQGSNAYKDLADSLYRTHNYQEAITYYHKALRHASEPGPVMLQLGKSFGKINKVHDAEAWFKKAHANQAMFTNSDLYEYVRILRMLEKHDEADSMLERMLIDDPHASIARQALDDIRNASRYYKDSAAYQITNLSINTPESEFAPAYFKDGIVFSSAQEETFAKKKYHWDNSNYLNLYFAKKDSGHWQKPALFERDLNTQYHDGPATFYSNNEKMIVNRNEASKSKERDDLWVWHISLYDGVYSSTTNSWLVTKMPFDQPPYSFAHPAVADGGNTLYFVSDIPGGYGGTDIYRVVRKNGIWTKPFNLGPMINTPGSEVFPFIENNTLYFASTGHGGLGGLDLFKSTLSTNGFGPAENLGYPFNSTADDFSLITTGNQETGFFASNRKGSDDIYSFEHAARPIPILAHIFDGVTKASLAGAEIQMITSAGADHTMTADSEGNIAFELLPETTYMIIGSKDGKVGMLTGMARVEEDRNHLTHPIAAYGDTSRVACIGVIKDEAGIAQNAAKITIIDETTGKKIEHAQGQSVVNFLGEKNHTYRVEIENEKGDVTVHTVSIGADESKSQSWSMVLKPSSRDLVIAAQVVRAADNQPLGGAAIKIITFSEADIDTVADAEGRIDFTLPEGTAYIVVGTKDELTGMHSGIAEKGMDKASITHPVRAQGDPKNPVSVMSLVTDNSGEIIKDAQATVTEKGTGKTVSATIDDGILTFLGERGKGYNVAIEKEGYTTTLGEITITADADPVEKGSMTLTPDEKTFKTEPYNLTAHVFRATDMKSLAGAEVKILNFEGPDLNLKADGMGLATFSLPEGTTFVIIGNKDGYTGMYTGIVEKGMDKSSIVFPVPAHPDPQKHVPIIVRINNENNEMIKDAVVTVTDKSTGETVPAVLKDGVVSFSGERGKDYSISVNHQDFNPASQSIKVPSQASTSEKVVISMTRKAGTKPSAAVATSTITQTTATVEGGTSASSSTNALLATAANQGDNVVASIQPAGSSTPLIADVKGMSENQVLVSGMVKDEQGVVLTDAQVVVIDKQTGEQVPSSFSYGVVNFTAEKGKTYAVEVQSEDFKAQSEDFSIPPTTESKEQLFIVMERNGQDQAAPMQTLVTDLEGLVNSGITVTDATLDNSILEAKKAQVLTNEVSTEYHGLDPTGQSGQNNAPVSVPNTTTNASVVPMAISLMDTQDAPINQAMITVTEKSSGKEIPATIDNSTINFSAKKGEEYAVHVEGMGFETVTKDVTVPTSGNASSETIHVEKNIQEPVFYSMAARVFKATDQSALGGAQVSVLNIVQPDLELKANSEGVAEFSLPEGTAFVIIGSKDGFTGMYSGEAETALDKSKLICPVPAYSDNDTKTQVVTMLTDNQGSLLNDAEATVTEKSTGQVVASETTNGVLSFVAEKGKEYKVEVTNEGGAPVEQTIAVDANAKGVVSHQIEMPTDSEDLSSSSLIVLNADGKGAKYYLVSNNKVEELVERDGKIYAQSENGLRFIKNGSLSELAGNASSVLDELSLKPEQMISIGNIYFDFNSAALKGEGKKELDKVKEIFKRYPGLRLDIGTHADDRGKASYNLTLSRKRANSIENYLEKDEIQKDRIKLVAFGETIPAIPCETHNCSENEHQKNRRAEFALGMGAEYKALMKAARKAKNENLLEAYGDFQKEGLLFKISVGAYRFNSTLTFEELKNLGTVEITESGGITYYFVTGYPTLREAQKIRLQVIDRGVKDAAIVIFYKDEKISVKEFKALKN